MQRANRVSPRGFTLIEAVITVSIIAILSAIAYPNYSSYVTKGRRAEAKAALLEDMQLFERHFSQVNSYYGAGTTTLWTGYKTWSGDSPTTGSYQILAAQCGASNGQCVELQASPIKPDSTCGTLVYRSTGEKYNMLTSGVYATTAGCW